MFIFSVALDCRQSDEDNIQGQENLQTPTRALSNRSRNKSNESFATTVPYEYSRPSKRRRANRSNRSEEADDPIGKAIIEFVEERREPQDAPPDSDTQFMLSCVDILKEVPASKNSAARIAILQDQCPIVYNPQAVTQPDQLQSMGSFTALLNEDYM